MDEQAERFLEERAERRRHWRDADALAVEVPDGCSHLPYPIVCVHGRACRRGYGLRTDGSIRRERLRTDGRAGVGVTKWGVLTVSSRVT